jgi:hypothetical protein
MTTRAGHDQARVAALKRSIERLSIEVNGVSFDVERGLNVARRVEAIFGPLVRLMARLERADVTNRDLARLYQALLADAPNAPSFKQLQDWLDERGSFSHGSTAIFICGLVIGDDNLQWLAEHLALTGGLPSSAGFYFTHVAVETASERAAKRWGIKEQ